MDIFIKPSFLKGKIKAIPSKSDAHRLLICSALSENETEIRLDMISDDIRATIYCIKALGGDVAEKDGNLLISPINRRKMPDSPELDCGESGSTLRFFLPVCAAVCEKSALSGKGRLGERPLSPLREELIRHGCDVRGEGLPIYLSGKLSPGRYELPGNVSSQFISGLMFALPMLDGDSEIVLTSALESAGYAEMTARTLSMFGVSVDRRADGWKIPGNQRYITKGRYGVEGDWSNAAAFLAMGAVSGGIICAGLDADSLQGDKAVCGILEDFGADVTLSGDAVISRKNGLSSTQIDASQIPDLVPVLAAVAALSKGTTVISNAGRLRLKESDRLESTSACLNALGAEAAVSGDSLIISGKTRVSGGVTDSFGDHRIVMAAAVLALGSERGVTIKNAQAIEKSYPTFFDDFSKLGGIANAVNIR